MKTKLCLLAMPIIFAACGNKGQNAQLYMQDKFLRLTALVLITKLPLQMILLMASVLQVLIPLAKKAKNKHSKKMVI